LQAGTYSASVDRRLLGALWPAAAVSGCAVTVASGMTVNIAAGIVAVPTGNSTGSMLCTTDAVEQVTLAAAPASGSNRYDLVVCQARGNDVDGGANNDFIFANVTGTAAASPTVPAVPANAVALAQIYVPGASASVTAGNITDTRILTIPPVGRHTLGYAQATASQGSITTGSDLTGLTVTFSTAGGRRVKLSGQIVAQSTAAGDYARLDTTDGAGTILQNLQTYMPGTAAVGMVSSVCLTPAAGIVTYKLRLVRSLGTGTLTMVAAGVTPAFILAEDLGPL
jgi:hypothetical protein